MRTPTTRKHGLEVKPDIALGCAIGASKTRREAGFLTIYAVQAINQPC